MDNAVLEFIANKTSGGKTEGMIVKSNSPFFNGLRSRTLAAVATEFYNEKQLSDADYLIILMFAYNTSAKDTAAFLRKYKVAASASESSVRVSRNRFRRKVEALDIDLHLVDMLKD